MLSVQNDLRQLQLQQQQQIVPRVSYNGDQRNDPFLVHSEPVSGLRIGPVLDARGVDEDMLMTLAHQDYKSGNFKQALENSKAVYQRNPSRTDNLLLLGAVHYQLHEFDLCIAKNEEALQIDPHFAECYGNMANAWKEKGNIDVAIRYYLIAIELRPNFADAWSNLASAYMRKGRMNDAAQCCRQALAINPHLVDAHSNLGNLMKAQGMVHEAYNCYVEALRIQPNFAIAWSNLAGLFMESGDLNRALQYYKEAVKLKPTFSDAYLNLGNVYKALGMPQEAIVCYQRALQARPEYAMAFGNLASIFYEQGKMDMAILNYRRAIACDAGFLEAYNNLGNALKDAGRVEEASNCYRQCLALQPTHPQALTNLGNIYMEWNMTPAAAQCYKATLSVTTGLSAPFNNLAIIYKQQGNYADAISCYNEVLRIDPHAADGLVNRGNTYKEIGRVTEAIQDYLRAVSIRPTMAEAHANLASAYKDSGHVEAAIKSYKQALALRPDFPEATCNLLHTLQCVCDWDGRKKMFIEVEGILQRQIKMSVLPSVQPFHAIAYPLDPMLALEISRKYAQHCSVIASRFGLSSFTHALPIPIKGGGRNGRLRIGYVSSDFGNHPLSHLMGSVFGMHDTENVEVFCYGLSPNDGSEWRLRIQSEAEHFIDVSALSSDMIARLINENQIQILINLNGYTKGARNEIFAMQPAPVQVSYMGFPGTTGATYIDYLVTDEFVSPSKFSHIYSETLVHLPHCYFVNDYKQKNRDVLDPACQPKRSDYGLPEDKFIFAFFNQLYKIDPDIFITWCNILKRVPNSALWLLRFPAAGEPRLRAYAAAQGVQPDQIIFTDVAMKSEHIKRSALADLFLDSPLCNAHTTGTDVLWAGLPMVTLPLEKMATRVAGSLCLATGLGEEMIVSSMKEYEEKAVSLALNRSKLQDLTQRLKASRMTCPLFDTTRWTDMERDKIWNLLQFGMEIQTNDHNSTSEQIPNCFLNPNWDNSVDQSDPFKPALSSIVSSPVTSNLGIPAKNGEQQNIVLRELIGSLGSICNSGDISPHSFMGGYTTTTNNSTNTSCYTTPLNSPPRLNLSVMDHQTRVGSLSNQLPSDPGFVKRAAKISCLGGSQMGIEENKDGFLSILSRSTSPERADFGGSIEESSVSEQIPGGDIGIKGQRDVNAKKRKTISTEKTKAKEIPSAPYTKEAKAADETEQSNSKRSKGDEVKQKQSKENSKAPEPLKDYIHVRARRGQATDSHSLAERVRREKISERMKFLQDLVPGCNKVTGKAVMLDEIINYVQSLQHQVEFLSMKLSNVNPRPDLNAEAILSKDIFQSCASLPQNIFTIDASSAQTFPYVFQSQQGSNLQSNMPNGTKSSLLNSLTTEIRQNADVVVLG